MPPKARVCYICGRPTLLPGYQQHVAQCKALFEKRELAKPPKERRPVPRDPMEFMGGTRKGGGFSDEEAFNDAALKSWEGTLVPCKYCGRTFLPEKLAIHNRSCTADHPAKRVAPSTGDDFSPLSSTRRGNGGTQSTDFDQAATYSQFRAVAGSSRKTSARDSSNDYSGKMNDFPTYGLLIKCKECGRNFNEVSYEKHAKVCRKVFQQKRKPYDSAKHRAEGTDLAAYTSSKRRLGNPSARSRLSYESQKPPAPSKWKQESRAFRDAVRQAKLVSVAERQSKQTGIPLHKLLPPTGASFSSSDYQPPSDYIQCPTCGRSFNQKAAERHIPQCKNIINKPKRLVKGSGHSAVSHIQSPNYSTPSRYEDNFDSYSRTKGSGSSKTRSFMTDNNSYFSNSSSRTHNPTDAVRLNSSSAFPSSSRTHNVNDPVQINPSYQFRR